MFEIRQSGSRFVPELRYARAAITSFKLTLNMTPNKLLTRVFIVFTLAGSLLFSNHLAAQEKEAAAEGDASGVPTDPDRISEGKAIFNANCKTCHKVKEKLVGPALAGVYDRTPSLDWIVNFVHNSSKVIASGDPYAVKLYNEFNKTQMTPFPTLTREQILSVMGYIKSEAEAPEVAETDTAAVANGGQAGGSAVPTGYLNAIMVGLVIVLVLILIVLFLITTVLRRYLNNQPGLDEEDKRITNASFDINSVVKSKPFLFLVVFVSAALIFKVVINNLYAVGIQIGYAPKQPIAFSHKLHAGDYDIDCNYCHTGVRISKNANIPSPNICMNCHTSIQNVAGQDGVSPEIQKIYDAIENDRPIEWVRVHNLPDLAYFNHSQHVKVGGIECQTCHGEVQEMEVIEQHALLTMGWCINCHRNTDVNTQGNEYYDNLVEIHNAESDEALKVEDIGGLECAKCHY